MLKQNADEVCSAKPSSGLVIRLFGQISIHRDQRPIELAYEKGRALLGYLAAKPGKSYSRASLAAMFWPDLDRPAALTNLRQVLHSLRKSLDLPQPSLSNLQIDRESVGLRLSGELEIEASDFFPLPMCQKSPLQADCSVCLVRMESLIGCYRGKFMADFSLPDCPAFEDWLRGWREAMHNSALDWLIRLSECHAARHAHGTALPFALRFLELAPDSEEGLRRAMRLLAMNGQHERAQAFYDKGCRHLSMELGLRPSDETRALAQRIRQGRFATERREGKNSLVATAHSSPGAGQRQVTVLCCELKAVAVTGLEEMFALMREPQAHCAEIIRTHGGQLLPLHGGSLLAYFGYPKACENAALAAARAAQALMGVGGDQIQVRAAVHSGMTLDGGDPPVPDATGTVSALALRLCLLADSGEVMISDAAQRLIAGYFDFHELQPQRLPEGMRASEVSRLGKSTGALSRVDAAANQGLTPLVGRTQVLATLSAAWREAGVGKRRMVLLRGDPGIGKSRLVFALWNALREQKITLRKLQCRAEHRLTPFHPLIDWFQTLLAFSHDDTLATRFDKLAAHVHANPLSQQSDAVVLLARMLALPLREPYQEEVDTADRLRERTITLLLEFINQLAMAQPLLLIIEDLHWADPSTLELMSRFVEQKGAAPLLAIFTSRPGIELPWQVDRVQTLELQSLDDTQTQALVTAVNPGMAPGLLKHIVARAQGIPLFAEELARSVANQTETTLPATLQDLLAARLDDLGATKLAAQAASAIGGDFEVALLRAIVPFDELTLARMLRHMRDAGLLWYAGSGVWQFKHALIHDAAYQSQTRDERQAVHMRIVQALTAAEVAPRHELLAQQLSGAGKILESIDCWMKAGQRAAQSSAHMESIGHYNSGLQELTALPANPKRDQTEFRLLVSLCPALYTAKGHGSVEATQVNVRLHALSAQLRDCPELFRAKWAQEFNTIARTGYRGAAQAAQQLLAMAHEDPLQQMAAHAMAAAAFSWAGDFKSSLCHADQVASFYTPELRPLMWEQFGLDLYTFGMAYSAFAQGFLGFSEQSEQVCDRMLERVRTLADPHTLAQALAFSAMLYCWSNQPEKALPVAAETIAISRQHGFFLWRITGEMVHGWALTTQGQAQGIAEVTSAVAGLRVAAPGMSVLFLYALAAAQVQLKQYQLALETVEQAQADVLSKGEHRFNAELQRLSGEAWLGLDATHAAQAEAHFHAALAISRQQQARGLELRAALSQARLWQSLGKHAVGRRLLEDTLDGFSSTHSTPDLQAARQLLVSLSIRRRN